MSWRVLILVATAGFMLALPATVRAAEEEKVLNVYSARHYPSDAELYAGFEKASGIRVRVIEGKGEELITRLTNEAQASPADVFIVVDAGNLWRAENAGLLRPVASKTLEARIPASLRDPAGRWFGFSKRARVIAVSRARAGEAAASTYAALADPRNRGQVCVRSSSNIYNLSFMAALIERVGEAKAEAWAKGVVANFARPPQGGDIDQITAIAAGECSMALVNHYYWVRLATSSDPADRKAADAVKLVFPDQAAEGTHVNIGGAGVLTHAPHPQNAQAFLEYLAGEEAQRIFAQGNNEYPAVPGVPENETLKALGAFKEDPINVAVYGRNQARAQMVYDRAGWP